MNLKRLVRSKAVWLTAAVLSLMLAAVAIAQAAPTILSGTTPPPSHADGRSASACTDCHTVVTNPTPIVLPVVVPVPGQDADDDDALEAEVEDVDEADDADDAQMDVDDADDAQMDVDDAEEAHEADEVHADSDDDDTEQAHDGAGDVDSTHDSDADSDDMDSDSD
ncbi:MAG: hypothetical protein Q7V14_06960 [Coriobacteriia bacterium]|nr:hypothetical protein [Coriobacteriia bacterium]MDO9108641.1 hypothetical protein [Coriobacteriia bacterium]